LKVLIDSDSVAFASAATSDDQDFWVAQNRCDDMVRRILDETKADEYELWLTGDTNFRYNIYPEYKAQRKKQYIPKWYIPLKQHLQDAWQANISQGCEADDMVGVRQMEHPPGESLIAHIDKDINMIPGMHYHWGIMRLGKVVRAPELYEVSDEEALYNFYYQLIVGDNGTDNIKGVRGAGPVLAQKLLQQHTSEEGRYYAISDLYSCYEEMAVNAKCLWIWRKMNDDVTERWKDWSGPQEENMVS
jgi:5'-3' exonuclease